MSDPVTVGVVAEYLRLNDVTQDVVVEEAVDAVNSLLLDWFGDLSEGTWDDKWPDRYILGGTMLAARIFRRRNSPAGVESFGELGPVYVQRNDPDVAQLLGLGAYKKPMVG